MAGKLSPDCQLSWTLGPAGYREVSPGLVTWGEWTLHCGSWGLKGCGLGSQQGATALHWKPASLLRVLFGFWTDNPSVPTSLRRWSVDAAAVQPCVLGWWGRGVRALSHTAAVRNKLPPTPSCTHTLKQKHVGVPGSGEGDLCSCWVHGTELIVCSSVRPFRSCQHSKKGESGQDG